MKRLLLLLPFAAAKADIIETYTFSFTGGNFFGPSSSPTFTNNSLTGNGTYSFNTTTGTATALSLTYSGVGGSGTYGLTDLAYGESDYFWLQNETLVDLYYGIAYNMNDLWMSKSFTVSSITTGGPAIAPVPEPSSWVLGLGGLMGMTVLASRKKKTTGSILKAPALLA